jgi:hypothetical protein
MTPRRIAGLLILLATFLSFPAAARVEITLDAATLTEFLTTVTPPKVLLDLPTGGQLALELRDVKVLGFDPSGGANGKGHILGALRVGIPALGLDMPLEPRLALGVESSNGEKVAVLRFERLPIPLPLTGSMDISSLLPVYRVPAESVFVLPLKTGDVNVKSRLVDTKMGADAVRLVFNLEMTPEGARARKEK